MLQSEEWYKQCIVVNLVKNNFFTLCFTVTCISISW